MSQECNLSNRRSVHIEPVPAPRRLNDMKNQHQQHQNGWENLVPLPFTKKQLPYLFHSVCLSVDVWYLAKLAGLVVRHNLTGPVHPVLHGQTHG